MVLNLGSLELIFDIIGVFILLMASLFGHHYSKNLQEKWSKRYNYWWFTLDKRKSKPLFKIVSKQGPFSPSHYMNIIGFVCVLAGFILQLVVYPS